MKFIKLKEEHAGYIYVNIDCITYFYRDDKDKFSVIGTNIDNVDNNISLLFVEETTEEIFDMINKKDIYRTIIENKKY